MRSQLRIFRYTPGEVEPTWARYELEYAGEMTMLRALFKLAQEHPDPPSFRRYQCNRGQCCSCLMTIDGEVKRACATKLGEEVVVEPLRDFPVIRDLVVDFGQKRRDGSPYLLQQGVLVRQSVFAWRPAQVDRNEVRGLIFDAAKCDGCQVCVRVCPVNKYHHLEDLWGERLPFREACIRPKDGKIDLSGACPQCAPSPCVSACPTGAITKEGGIVYIHDDTCIGCGLCLRACPVETIFLNMERGYAVKCDLCQGRPRCVKGCKPKALIYAEALG